MLLATAVFLFGHPLIMLPAMAAELSCQEMHERMRSSSAHLTEPCVQTETQTAPAESTTTMWCCVEDQAPTPLNAPSNSLNSIDLSLHPPSPIDLKLSQSDALPSRFAGPIFYLLKQREKLRTIVIRD